MKKQLAVLLLLALACTSFCQQMPATPPTKSDYLAKSKSQKIAAWIFLGVGAGAFAIAAPGKVSFDILPVLVIGGAVAVLTSIPLFIGAAKNKRKARNASAFLKIESRPAIQNTFIASTYYPAVSLRINFH
jgi:hypothetical protein